MDTDQIQHRFTINGYTDALYFTPAEYAALTPTELTAMQQARYESWVSVVNESVDDTGSEV